MMCSDDDALYSAIGSLEDDANPEKILLVRRDTYIDKLYNMICRAECNSRTIKDILKVEIPDRFDEPIGEKGYTALHLAALKSVRNSLWDSTVWGTVAEILIEHGSDVNARDNEGCTPLHLALQPTFGLLNRYEVIDVLLKHGSDVSAVNLNGDTPLHLYPQNRAEYLGDMSATNADCLYQGFEHFGSLVKRAGDVNVVNSKGETVLHVLLRHIDSCIHVRWIQLLLDYGADVGKRDADLGENAYEAYYRTIEKHNRAPDPRILILLQSSEQRLENSSALHVACLFHRHDSVRELLQLGADVNALDNLGYSPLAYGFIRSGREDKASTLKLMLDNGADMFHKITVMPSWTDSGTNASIIDMQLCKCVGCHGPRHSYCPYPIFYEHLAKHSALHKQDMNVKGGDAEWSRHFDDWLSGCSEELTAMRECKVSSGITFLDLLLASAGKMAIYAKNKELVKAFHAKKAAFPMYQAILDGKLAKQLARRKLVESAAVSLSDALGFADPSDEFYERTLSYCSNDDLMRVIDAMGDI